MPDDIHGHAVMDLILASRRAFSRDSLVAYIEQQFGANARFCTCSAAGLSAGDLVALLEQKGKLSGPADAMTVDVTRVCRH